ncbi:MAG: PRC-barrel domain-containing protein [Gallionellaceae bacterium]|nr:PRC-barrel domain-containing protein [Gallionellaceae bacterium]
MSYLDREAYKQNNDGPGPHIMGASTLTGDEVCNLQDENLGDIKEIMLDMNDGTVRYAVLSFGGFIGVGEKLFAVPWEALTLDTQNKRFLLNVDKERLQDAPGFDKDRWPDMADPVWQSEIHAYYGTESSSHHIQSGSSTARPGSNINVE